MRFRIALAAIALLVFGMSGVASAQATGDLVFVHGIPAPAGPPVDVVIYPNDGEVALDDIVVQPGTTTAPIPLPAATHGIEVYVSGTDTLLGSGVFTIAAGATTTITATAGADGVVVDISDPVPDPTPTPTPTPTETATPRPQTVTVPTRVETGAGGAADGALELVLGGLAAAVAIGALTLGLRRRTAA